MWGLLLLAHASRWGQPSAWSETCQFVPWDMGTEAVKRGWAVTYLVLTPQLPQILSLLVNPVSQRAAM